MGTSAEGGRLDDFVGSLKGRVTCILGNGKNVGKTTFLNFAASRLREWGPVGLASIGVDGETHDQIFGTPKPRVRVCAQDVVVTTAGALAAARGDFEVLAVAPERTVLGHVVAARARRDAYVELIGPETNSRLAGLLAELMSEHGVSTVLVDGAVNRVTQVAARVSAGFVEVLWATPSTRVRAEERLRFLAWMNDVPLWDGADDEAIVIGGALTAEKLQALRGKGLVLEDFTRVFVPLRELQRFRVWFRQKFELRGVVLNLFDLESLTAPAGLPILLNPYQGCAP